MFRWCSNTQSYMGECPPLDSYCLSHGICDKCESKISFSHPDLSDETLQAKRMMDLLFSSFEKGDSFDCQQLVRDAQEMGIGRTEVFLGLLQPALYQIGELWKTAKINPSQEHLFTSWCEQIYLLLTTDIPIIESSDILLANMPGNIHTLGINFVRVLLHDLGIKCAVANSIPTNQGLVDKCIREQTKICGISVSMPGMVSSAIQLAEDIASKTDGKTRVALGGFAFRMGFSNIKSRIPIFITASEFSEYLRRGTLAHE